MAEYLDVTNWARRDLFEFFRGYDKPYFNVCTHLDITRLLALLRKRPDASVSLAYHYLALRIANEIEPFRYRLRDGKVLVHEVIHGATTVLLANESFTFAYFHYTPDYRKFTVDTQRVITEVQREGIFRSTENDDLIHFTTLPWVSFTSFSHARNWCQEDSVPKISFGKFTKKGKRVVMPFSIEVHHALMDGLHVGRYLSRLEEALADPEANLDISIPS
jgi:chloramphenicol O-acetyltransferase type A